MRLRIFWIYSFPMHTSLLNQVFLITAVLQRLGFLRNQCLVLHFCLTCVFYQQSNLYHRLNILSFFRLHVRMQYAQSIVSFPLLFDCIIEQIQRLCLFNSVSISFHFLICVSMSQHVQLKLFAANVVFYSLGNCVQFGCFWLLFLLFPGILLVL